MKIKKNSVKKRYVILQLIIRISRFMKNVYPRKFNRIFLWALVNFQVYIHQIYGKGDDTYGRMLGMFLDY